MTHTHDGFIENLMKMPAPPPLNGKKLNTKSQFSTPI